MNDDDTLGNYLRSAERLLQLIAEQHPEFVSGFSETRTAWKNLQAACMLLRHEREAARAIGEPQGAPQCSCDSPSPGLHDVACPLNNAPFNR